MKTPNNPDPHQYDAIIKTLESVSQQQPKSKSQFSLFVTDDGETLDTKGRICKGNHKN
jgi:hypothetical protein